MRGAYRLWVAALLMAAVVPGLVSSAASEAHAPSVRPLTVPALRDWVPAAGTFRFGADAAVIAPAHSARVAREAKVLATSLSRLGSRNVPVRLGVAATPGDIELQLTRTDPQLGREGYRLEVGHVVRIAAAAPAGLFYGGRSLLQLLAQDRTIPAGVARDWPTYPERGLMVDASRTVYSTAWVLREIRRLGALKLNFLHLHLTDDQRWGIASRTYPDIAAKGAFSRSDIRRILEVATRNHVTVIPEIEMPGHLASFLKSHPGLILKPVGVVSPTTSGAYTTDKLDITSAAARRAMRRILEEYLPLFPGKYWDVGADEYLSPAEYPLFPQLASYALRKYGVGATPADAIHGFLNWVDRIVRAHGKTLRAWNDQLGGTGRVPVNSDVVIDWWNAISPLGDAVTVSPQTLLRHGYRIVNAGWYPNYYASDIGPASGKANLAGVFDHWQVNQFESNEFGDIETSRQTVPATSPGLLGSAVSIWGPLQETTEHTASEVQAHLAVLAQKTWNTTPNARTYPQFVRDQHRVGLP